MLGSRQQSRCSLYRLGDWADRGDLKAHLDQFIAHEASAEERDKTVDALPDAAPGITAARCRQSFLSSKRLPLSEEVLEDIPYYYARYDGKVLPFEGEEIPYLARHVRFTEMAELVRSWETHRAQRNVSKPCALRRWYTTSGNVQFPTVFGINRRN